MEIWKAIRAAFGTSQPPDARRLSAVDERTLSASIKGLFVGERGWITLPEARALFSLMDEDFAFGEMDEEGKTRLAEFAASVFLRGESFWHFCCHFCESHDTMKANDLGE